MGQPSFMKIRESVHEQCSVSEANVGNWNI